VYTVLEQNEKILVIAVHFDPLDICPQHMTNVVEPGSGMQSGLCRFFKRLDFANPRPVSTGFAGNIGFRMNGR
jgi:hypothetical protein